MGNPLQLTARARQTLGQRYRPVVFAAGTISMLLITTASSLAVWIALPWAFLDWSPTLVTSGSMTPVISPGDVVMIRPTDREGLHPNSVVVYDRPGTGPILHRIIAELPDGTFQTQGDASASPDSEPVRMADVQGVAVLAVPWVGRPSLWLHQGEVFLVVVTGVTALAMIALAPRAFDAAFDPWGSVRRVNPVEVLLGRSGTDRAERWTATSGQLLPAAMHDRVLERFAAQSAATSSRTIALLEGLS